MAPHGGGLPNDTKNDRKRRSGHQEIACKGVRSGLGTLLSVGAADSGRGRRSYRIGKAACPTLERGHSGRRTPSRSRPKSSASANAQRRANRSVGTFARMGCFTPGGFCRGCRASKSPLDFNLLLAKQSSLT
jgi:hypothetical protein